MPSSANPDPSPARALFILTILAALSSATSVSAQTLTLLADINREPIGEPSSTPRNLIEFGGFVYFTAETPFTGRELYRTGGSPNSTVLVADIFPGPNTSSPRSLMTFGGALIFVADEGLHGFELWQSDGTAAGTHLLADANPGPSPSNPRDFVAVGNRLFFLARDIVHGAELWVTDGTTAGTALVVDLRPGAADGGIDLLGALGGNLLFAGDNGVAGKELWATDGTPAGTFLVADLLPGAASSSPAGFGALGGSAYFGATDAAGRALWRLDNVTTAPVRLAAVAPSLEDRESAAIGGALLFPADDGSRGRELWRTDGTVAGTFLLKELTSGATRSDFANFAAVGGMVYFGAASASLPLRLWKSDGTAAGTMQLGSLMDTPRGFVDFNGQVYFVADSGAQRQLWRTDGTGLGTTTVSSVQVGFDTVALVRLGGVLLFGAIDPQFRGELFVSAGTAATTGLLADIAQGAGVTQGSQPSDFVDLPATTLFLASDGVHGRELWRTDGTRAGTSLLLDRSGSSPPSILTVVGDECFFYDSDTRNLWLTDGTTTRTRVVKTLPRTPIHPVAVGETLFFALDYGTAPSELWKSDGTAAGTVLLRQFPVTFPDVTTPRLLTALGDVLFFHGNDGATGEELWTSDGTTAGTRLFLDIVPGAASSDPCNLFVHHGKLYFEADSSLWISDGSVAGTVRTGYRPLQGTFLRAGRTVFLADPPRLNLWRLTDTDSLVLLPASVPGSASRTRIALGDSLLWFETLPTRLWSSDGTVQGTRLVGEFAGQVPSFIGTGGRAAWFVTSDARLWRSNGTPEGTRDEGRLIDLLQPVDQRPSANGFPITVLQGSTGYEAWVFEPGAHTRVVGQPCGRGRRAPTLDASDPILGARLYLRGDNAIPGALGIVMFGPPLVTRLAPACRLYVAVPTPLLAFTPTAAAWDRAVRLPRDPSLFGVTEAMQVVFGPTDGPLGVDYTNAVHVTYGAQPLWD